MNDMIEFPNRPNLDIWTRRYVTCCVGCDCDIPAHTPHLAIEIPVYDMSEFVPLCAACVTAAYEMLIADAPAPVSP